MNVKDPLNKNSICLVAQEPLEGDTVQMTTMTATNQKPAARADRRIKRTRQDKNDKHYVQIKENNVYILELNIVMYKLTEAVVIIFPVLPGMIPKNVSASTSHLKTHLGFSLCGQLFLFSSLFASMYLTEILKNVHH